MHDCLIVSVCKLSLDSEWQVRGVDVEKNERQGGSLREAINDRRNLFHLLLPGLRSRCLRFFDGFGEGFLRTLGVGVEVVFFYLTPEVQLNHLLQRTPE